MNFPGSTSYRTFVVGCSASYMFLPSSTTYMYFPSSIFLVKHLICRSLVVEVISTILTDKNTDK